MMRILILTLIIKNLTICQRTHVRLNSVNLEGIGVKAFCPYGVNFIMVSFLLIKVLTELLTRL